MILHMPDGNLREVKVGAAPCAICDESVLAPNAHDPVNGKPVCDECLIAFRGPEYRPAPVTAGAADPNCEACGGEGSRLIALVDDGDLVSQPVVCHCTISDERAA